jgi:hypothetical protein
MSTSVMCTDVCESCVQIGGSWPYLRHVLGLVEHAVTPGGASQLLLGATVVVVRLGLVLVGRCEGQISLL